MKTTSRSSKPARTALSRPSVAPARVPAARPAPKPVAPPPPPAARKPATGTQAIERAIVLMKLLATRGRFGWGLTDISRRAGLDKATVRRILACLETERLAGRDFRDHRYLPGPMLIELGLSVFPYQPYLDECRASIAQLSQRTGGTAFAFLRSGSEYVVAGRAEQTHHRGMLHEVGMRRPLLASAGGIAILIALPARERAQVVRENFEMLARTDTPRPERFKRMLARSLEMGLAVNLEDVAPGVHSFALSVPGYGGAPLGALSVAGPAQQFPLAQAERYQSIMAKEVMRLTRCFDELFPGRGLAPPAVPDAAG